MTTASKPETPARSVKITVAVLVGLILIGVGLFLFVARNAGLATAKGFLGTRAGLFADLNLIAEIILLVGLMVGYGFARQGNIPAHQYNQTAWVLFNIVLTEFIMAVAFNRQVVPGIPTKLLRSYYAVSTAHAILGGITILCGIYLVLRMNKLLPKALRVSWWKNLMRVTLGLYWVVGLFGLGTYYIWYVQPREASGAPETANTGNQPNTVVVPLANYVFNPFELTIPVGTTVLFRNDDPDPHTVTFDNGEFPEGGMEEGETYQVTFDKVGDFPYYCAFHGSPGGHDMAGMIHVVAAGQVAALPTVVAPPAPTPQPTPAAPAAAPLGPQALGFGAFRDAAARNDEFELVVSDLSAPASGELHVWLTGSNKSLNLGKLTPDASGDTEFSYIDPNGANLLADYSGFAVTVETAGASPASPSSEIVVGNSIPAGALAHAQQLLVASEKAPKGRAYALGIVAQTEQLFRHAKAVNSAALFGDFNSLNRHIEHLFTIIDGKGGARYKDFDGDGLINDAGDGFGIRNYAEAVTAEAQAAAAAPDATENVKTHAAHLLILADNLRTWSDQLIDLAIKAHQATTLTERQKYAAQLFQLSQEMLAGVDANNNGVIEPVPGEGGAYTLYFHSQYLAAMGALKQE
jgi:plastocyanin/uncharacterized membrane protein YozB (DUF420 family)